MINNWILLLKKVIDKSMLSNFLAAIQIHSNYPSIYIF